VTGPSISFRTVCLDCADAHEMARFYGGLLGWESTVTEDDWILMRDPAGGVGLSFQAEAAYVEPVWPERPDAQQKMIHLEVRVTPADPEADLTGDAGQEALESAARVAVAMGGRLADHQSRTDLRVVLDPAGHPLCLFLD
jgi:catechol 2,3-dioxygenase-like lactoylglutathione lyase family enzyme